MAHIDLAGIGQADRASRSIQQLRVEGFFKQLDLLGQGGLRHVQRFRCPREAMVLGNREEIADRAGEHQLRMHNQFLFWGSENSLGQSCFNSTKFNHQRFSGFLAGLHDWQ
jgi:hypothetical protein